MDQIGVIWYNTDENSIILGAVKDLNSSLNFVREYAANNGYNVNCVSVDLASLNTISVNDEVLKYEGSENIRGNIVYSLWLVNDETCEYLGVFTSKKAIEWVKGIVYNMFEDAFEVQVEEVVVFDKG